LHGVVAKKNVKSRASAVCLDIYAPSIYCFPCRDLRDIPKNAAVRRVNELVKRARTAKVHSLVCACLRKMMPGMFGKEKKQKELLQNLEIIFQAVAQEHGISPGDFPDADVYREKLTRWTGTGR
jgi:hypothetical protein